MVIWCSEEYITTAIYRMQQALEVLESWTKKWSVKVNSTKTTYTVFSLSLKEQKVTLRLGNQTLNAQDNPLYLGVTFDKRLTWKQHTQRTESRAKVRLALMKKLASTTWGADASTLKRHRDILEQDPQKISQCPEIPAWRKERHFLVKSGVAGIDPKDSPNDLMRKLITLEHLQQCYPMETWTYIFTDGSAEDATCNGGAGVYVKYPDGTEDRLSFATGLYSTNYKAETEALRAAAAHIENSHHISHSHRVVFLSDALSVLQALQTGKDTDLNNLVSTGLCMKHTVILQWIPSHCGIHGNETADTLAKEGTTYAQNDRSTTYSEVKKIIKAKQQNLFKQNHPHADDLVLWRAEESIYVAKNRIQQALDVLYEWTKRWMDRLNADKTTYSVFSLSPNQKKVVLKINGECLKQELSPTYLGITFDRRLAWKSHIEKAEKKAKTRLTIVRKLAGSKWGADMKTLNKAYVGNVRPALEYVMATWEMLQSLI